MKFTRRAEGIKAARLCFKKAREDERSTYHVFVAAALMEYFCTKDKNIAVKIFELGLRKFHDNEEYVNAYLDFLSHLNGNTISVQRRVLRFEDLMYRSINSENIKPFGKNLENVRELNRTGNGMDSLLCNIKREKKSLKFPKECIEANKRK